MSADDGGVNHGVFVVGLCSERAKDPLPDPAGGPAAPAPMHVLPEAKALRQIAPGNPGPVPLEHRLDKQAVVLCRYPHCAFPSR